MMYNEHGICNMKAENKIKQFVNGIINAVKGSSVEAQTVSEEITYSDLDAAKQDIKDWQVSRLTAQSVLMPDYTDFTRVLNDIMVDSHINGIINSIKNKIKSKEFNIYSADGNIDEEKTKLFKNKWFFKYVDYVVESIFYPYSLIELGNSENNALNEIKLVPREYVIPQSFFIKKSLYSSSVNEQNGWFFNSEEYAPYYIYLPSMYPLGLLDIAAPHAIGKKFMMQYWWRFAEKFSIPFRLGKTDIQDPKRKSNMENMFKNWVNAMYAVMDTQDDVTLEMPKMTDVYSVFLELMKYSNNEISKALAGAVGIFDEKSFVGSSEAGERLFNEFVSMFVREVTFSVNNELIPRLINTYRFPLKDTDVFQYESKTNATYQETIEAVRVLSPSFIMDAEQVGEKLGFTLENRTVLEGTAMKDAFSMYKPHMNENEKKQWQELYKKYMKK